MICVLGVLAIGLEPTIKPALSESDIMSVCHWPDITRSSGALMPRWLHFHPQCTQDSRCDMQRLGVPTSSCNAQIFKAPTALDNPAQASAPTSPKPLPPRCSTLSAPWLCRARASAFHKAREGPFKPFHLKHGRTTTCHPLPSHRLEADVSKGVPMQAYVLQMAVLLQGASQRLHVAKACCYRSSCEGVSKLHDCTTSQRIPASFEQIPGLGAQVPEAVVEERQVTQLGELLQSG